MKKRSKLGWIGLAIATLILLAILNYLDARVFDKLNPFASKFDSSSEQTDISNPEETEQLSEDTLAQIDRFKSVTGLNEPAEDNSILSNAAATLEAERLGERIQDSQLKLSDIEENIDRAKEKQTALDHKAQYDRLRALADINDPETYFNLASFLTSPETRYFDKTEAATLFMDAAINGHSDSVLGMLYVLDDRGLDDFTRSQILEWIELAADEGRSDAQYAFARLHGGKVGNFPQNKKLYEKWAKQSADKGFIYGLQEYGYGLKYGSFGEKDEQSAISYFQQAAEQGHGPSQYELGHSHYTGAGVTVDKATGLAWIKKAARQGEVAAQQSLRNLGETW